MLGHVLLSKLNENKAFEVYDITRNKEERINEIARMISGEEITSNAIKFAKNLLTKKGTVPFLNKIKIRG